MKSGLIFFLICLVALLSFSSYMLRKELLNAKERFMLLEERNNKLHTELSRLSSHNRENKRFLTELEQLIKELESKIPFTNLEQYIPKPVWRDIKPIIDKLKVLQETRQSMAFPEREE